MKGIECGASSSKVITSLEEKRRSKMERRDGMACFLWEQRDASIFLHFLEKEMLYAVCAQKAKKKLKGVVASLLTLRWFWALFPKSAEKLKPLQP